MQTDNTGKTAVVAGASGLIGGFLVDALLQDASYEKVVLITRRPLDRTHPKVVQAVVDFTDEAGLRTAMQRPDAIFCAVGTTQQKVKGDKAQYRKVDYDIPVNLARIGRELGAQACLLVSAVGANAASGNFYLQLKGEVEAAIAVLQYPSFYALRPSLLLGPRKEFRLGEKVAVALSGVMDLLMRGRLSRYRPIEAKTVARALVAAARESRPGAHIWEYDQMRQQAAVLIRYAP